MLHRLRALGLSTRVYEAGGGVGGTWYWNRYPGARVDVESQEYSYSFSAALEDEWQWTERYASQPELLRYLEHVAHRFDLLRDIQLHTRVTAAVFEEAAGRWSIATDRGDRVSARFCVMATGCLSAPSEPKFPGAESFKGATYHTSRWPHTAVDFTGRKVGVIGTGSSGVQAIPLLAEQADHLWVFQRTPTYCAPAHNHPLSAAACARWKSARAENRRLQRASITGYVFAPFNEQSALAMGDAERERTFEERWQRGGFNLLGAFADLLLVKSANDHAAAFMAGKIRSIVNDARTADLLTPKDFPFGAKRLCVDSGYYATFNRSNVSLVDLRTQPIEQITPAGIRTSGGEIALDAIVFATGFDAMTGALNRIEIRGRGGVPLSEAWAAGPRSYLGLMVAGFPNLFTVTGPGSPSVLTNMVVAIEQHVEWIADCLAHMLERRLTRIEPAPEAQDAWVNHVNEFAAATLLPKANSWYLGANVPGKPRVFMPYVGGVGRYGQHSAAIAADGYTGFNLRP
jgi:cyclohexanone monooxygenase